MEATLGNDDVRSIWSEQLSVAVQSVDRTAGTYQLVTLTDGAVHATALLIGDSTVAAGRQLLLTRHRVQWINGTRYWFVTAWTETGAAASASKTQFLAPDAPPPPPAAEHPFCLQPAPRAAKRARTNEEHPFLL